MLSGGRPNLGHPPICPTWPPHPFMCPAWPLVALDVLSDSEPTQTPTRPSTQSSIWTLLGGTLVRALRDGSAVTAAGQVGAGGITTLSSQCSRREVHDLVGTGGSDWTGACGEDKHRGLLLAASRSQTRMEPDCEPATMSSSGALRRTLSTGDV